MKQKVAILGGGMGALASAFYLSNTEEMRSRFDVTVYQKGWRLGGKLASGRNPEKHYRNEEHGLHMWLGYYENAFRLLRDLYDNWEQPEGYIFPEWEDVFTATTHSSIGRGVENGQLRHWDIVWPTNNEKPGEKNPRLIHDLWTVVQQVLDWMYRVIRDMLSELPDFKEIPFFGEPIEDALGVFKEVLGQTEEVAGTVREHLTGVKDDLLSFLGWNSSTPQSEPEEDNEPHEDGVFVGAFKNAARFLEVAAQIASRITNKEETPEGTELRQLLYHFELWFIKRFRNQIGNNDRLYTAYTVLDYGSALVTGLLNPAYNLSKNWDVSVLNKYEFREWLRVNGATDMTLRSSAVQNLYDIAFAYRDGDVVKPDIAAGVAIRVVLRILLTYKGAMSYITNAGFGGSVIGPMYDALVQQGVKFEFFHKVSSLQLSEDKSRVERIVMSRQAETVDGSPYDPIIHVEGLLTWPNQPKWELLKDGAALKKAKVNFESHWYQKPAVGEVVLTHRAEENGFDICVLAISLGAFKPLNDEDPSLCKELIEANEHFRDMVEKQGLIPTVSLQLWMDKTLRELGWTSPTPYPLVSAPWELNIWADMSQVLEYESYPEDHKPSSLFYICGTTFMPEYCAPRSDAEAQQRADLITCLNTRRWLGKYAGTFWPNASDPRNPRGLDWSVLYAPDDVKGEARLDEQYIRCNITPTECCTGSHTDTVQYRLAPDESGFANLFLSGAWTKNGINAESVEGAVMSARHCVRALAHVDLPIPGEEFLHTNASEILTLENLREHDAYLPDPLVQWWYWTGHLKSKDGRRFGFLMVFFIGNPAFFAGVMGDAVAGTVNKGQMTHFAITELPHEDNEGLFRTTHEHKLWFQPIELDHRFRLESNSGALQASGGGGQDQLKGVLAAEDGHPELSMELKVAEAATPVIHYNGKRHDYVMGGDTWYYSREKMDASGTLTWKKEDGEDEVLEVEGSAWFDRQYGDLLDITLNGWHWFSIQLDNDTQIMLFQFPNIGRGGEEYGNITTPAGTTFLHGGDFELDVIRFWTSPRTQRRYPLEWKLKIQDEVYIIKPALDNQEVGFLLNSLDYWEGACEVFDEEGARAGQCYVELVNFQKLS